MKQLAQPATPHDGIAWIIGASSGIGAALATELSKRGWRVAISARRAEILQQMAADNPNFIPLALDITDAAAVNLAAKQLEEQHGAIALLVVNAGTYLPDAPIPFDLENFTHTQQLNLLAPTYALAAVLPVMQHRGKGHIALVASVAGYVGLPRALAYGSSKAGLINFAESLRAHMDDQGILIQLVNPGFIKTPLTDKNDFPMPFLMPVDQAAIAFANGLKRRQFEISFPRPFVMIMKFLRALPYGLFFWLTKKMVR